MTSTTEMAGHPDVTEISDLAEGLLPPSRAAAVRRHLDACELCADVHASLAEIRGLLGTLPGPPRMPADVAQRIDAALAAEALLNTKVPESPEEPTVGSGLTSEDAGSSGDAESSEDTETDVSRETSTPAGRPAGRPRAATGPGRKGRTRSGRRRVAVLSAAFTVAALGIGSVLLASLGDDQPTRDTAGERADAPADTFSEGKLQKQVAGLLAEEKSEGGGGSRTPLGAATAPDGNSPRVLKEPVVPGCVREGIGREDIALAVENGRYQGKKALLVLLPAAADPTRVTAYIVDATCVDHRASGGPGKILLERTYPSV
ncbi:anti-sigma factor family protein [Streptomyces sp. NPDC055952]|uniref:anti-sigma factor family protein n=1 Tax=Streptomyces sp. NPDC055952 TaxID=3345663 RepID=UPI0035D712FD